MGFTKVLLRVFMGFTKVLLRVFWGFTRVFMGFLGFAGCF